MFGTNSTAAPPQSHLPDSEANASLTVDGKATDRVDASANVNSAPGDGQRSWLERLLSQTVRVEISDGRVIYGRLMCTDRDLNLVLGHAEEHGPTPGETDVASPTLVCRRQIGVVMVPGKHVVSCSVDATESVTA